MLIQGRGFIEGGVNLPRCRFGTPANYIIVEADIMSYNRMVCRTPEGLKTHDFTQWPADVPFAVALTPDSFEPWTQTSHKFRFYKQPSITKIEPELVEVGRITEVMVAIERDESDTSPESQENVFFEPIPS